jgi:hypothetical protein
LAIGIGDIIMQRSASLALTGLLMLAAAPATTPAAWADDTGLASMHELRREHGRLCMADHWHSGSGEGRSKAAARAAAIRSWADFTDFEYGSAWAHFSRAANPSTRFIKAANGWSADVDARPCRG